MCNEIYFGQMVLEGLDGFLVFMCFFQLFRFLGCGFGFGLSRIYFDEQLGFEQVSLIFGQVLVLNFGVYMDGQRVYCF